MFVTCALSVVVARERCPYLPSVGASNYLPRATILTSLCTLITQIAVNNVLQFLTFPLLLSGMLKVSNSEVRTLMNLAIKVVYFSVV